MTTTFILSVIGLALSIGALGLGALYALYRWKNKKAISFNALVVSYITLFILIGAFSGYKFLTSSYYLTKQGVGYMVDKGQDLVSSVMSFGMVTIIDGFGKTAEHYEQKWEQQKVAQSDKMSFSIVAVEVIKDANKPMIHITFSAKNSSNQIVSLNQMIKDELILLKDDRGLCFPLTLSDNREITIAPNSSIVSEVDVLLPKGVTPKAFMTPNGVLSLGR